MISRLLITTAIITLPLPVMAQSADQSAQDIIVTAHALRDMGLMSGSMELEGDELIRATAVQIGDMLAKMPGVSATGFAPGASRPVLRGLSGDRVKVLLDGLGAIDASSVSADHGVALDTLTIDHLDVLHGPALLAFGGQAIGGAVNARDKRIPRAMPEDGFDLTTVGMVDSVSNGKTLAAALDIPLADRLAFHIDANWHDAGNLRIGGDLLSPQLQSEILATGDADLAKLTALRGEVPNSFARGSTFGASAAFLDEGGSIGISVSRIDNRYGIPSRPAADSEEVSIKMGQTRFDLRGHLALDGFFDSLQMRGAFGDYQHSEIEGGAVGTLFTRKGIETRLELVQADNNGWTGRSGVQFSGGKLSVTGDEAILPQNEDSRLGLFTLQSVKLSSIELEAAGRYETVGIQANGAGFDKTFTLYSAAAGVAWNPDNAIKLGLNFSHGERAPSPEELLTDGLHVATQAYEIGDAALTKERSNGVEAYLHFKQAGTAVDLTVYQTRFAGFIAPLPTGVMTDGFPEYAYRQLPARFRGFEVRGSQQIAEWGSQKVSAEVSADYVRAALKNAGPVPRIPPLRIMGALEYTAPTLTLRGELEWNAAQNRIGGFEYSTAAFTLMGFNATWAALGEDGPLTLIASADNLLNSTGRRAASFTRDFMPIAGRNFRLSAKLSF